MVWAVIVTFTRDSRPGMRCLATAAAASALARASSPVFHKGLAPGLGLAAMIACICGLISSLVGAGRVRAGRDRSSAEAGRARPQARTRPSDVARRMVVPPDRGFRRHYTYFLHGR